jgi:DNA-directed RNA polymerase subunit RPC12/RpoP
MSKYILFCDYCGYKIISDLKNLDLYELKNDTLSGKKYRCKNCGRAISPRKFKDPQKDLEKKQEEERIDQENKIWLQSSIDFQANFLKENEDE